MTAKTRRYPGIYTLFDAVERDNLDAARDLLDRGTSPDQVNNNGSVILMTALWRKRRDIARLLIERGANVNPRPREVMPMGSSTVTVQATALNAAMSCGLDMLELMVEKGADVQQKDYGRTPLTLSALTNRREEAARFLIEKGVDVDARDDLTKGTALMMAAERDLPEMVSYLIGKGADITLADKDGRTALAIAEEKGKTECADILRRAIKAREAAFSAAAEKEVHDAVVLKQDRLKKRAVRFKLGNG